MKSQDEQALEIAKSFLETISFIKDKIMSDSITGYKITTVLRSKKTGKEYNLCLYASTDYIKLVGADELATMKLKSLLINDDYEEETKSSSLTEEITHLQ